MRLAIAVSALCLCAGRAFAWDAAVKAAPARIDELQAAWAKLDDKAKTKDIMKRAAQKTPPAWIKKKSWQESDPGGTYIFGVGVAKLRTPNLTIMGAEDRARAEIAKSKSADLPGIPQAEIMKAMATVTTFPLDWYRDGDDNLYALVVAQK